MIKAIDAVNIAKKEIGYQEKPGNNNKYGAYFKVNNQAWCYYFVSWVLITAGMNITPCGYCPDGYKWYKKNKQLFKVPVIGDLAFFAFDPGLKKAELPQHIGIVSKVYSNYFMCIEGNTSPTNAGSQDQGDGVYEKKRYYSQVLGFGRPPYQV